MLDIKFKDYTIGKPCYLGNKEPSPWEFKSVGTRYLKYYSEGLNEWLLKVMDLLEHQLLAEENTDDC